MHRTVAAALVAALALAFASCGGSEPQLTRAQLVRKIEVACDGARTAAERTARTHRGIEGLLAAALTSQQYITDRIDDLNPPDAAKDDFDAFAEGVRQRLALYTGVKSEGAKIGYEKASRAVQARGEAIFTRLDEAAKRLGVRNCV